MRVKVRGRLQKTPSRGYGRLRWELGALGGRGPHANRDIGKFRIDNLSSRPFAPLSDGPLARAAHSVGWISDRLDLPVVGSSRQSFRRMDALMEMSSDMWVYVFTSAVGVVLIAWVRMLMFACVVDIDALTTSPLSESPNKCRSLMP